MKDLAKYEGGHKSDPKRDGDNIWPRCKCKWLGDATFSIVRFGYRDAKRLADKYWHVNHGAIYKN